MARFGRLCAVLACVALATGCAAGPSGPEARPADKSVDYLPGLAADVYLPPGATDVTAPAVVLLPGGAWRTADRSGLRPLGARLAARGFPAVVATYRAAADGVRLRRSVTDIRCAAAFAATVSARYISRPRPVVLLGHSSGAHLAAVAALGPPAGRPSCRWGTARVIGLVGLAGPYAVTQFAKLVEPLIGAPPARAPSKWAAADPLRLAANPPAGLAVLLLHGTADTLVPVGETYGLALALRHGGSDATIRLIANADHHSVYTPRVAGPPMVKWLARWIHAPQQPAGEGEP